MDVSIFEYVVYPHIAHDGLEYIIYTPRRSSTITRFTKDDHKPLSTPIILFICRTEPAKPGEHPRGTLMATGSSWFGSDCQETGR